LFYKASDKLAEGGGGLSGFLLSSGKKRRGWLMRLWLVQKREGVEGPFADDASKIALEGAKAARAEREGKKRMSQSISGIGGSHGGEILEGSF